MDWCCSLVLIRTGSSFGGISCCLRRSSVSLTCVDLYGLVLFLGADPYWVKFWWNKLLFEPFVGVVDVCRPVWTGVVPRC